MRSHTDAAAAGDAIMKRTLVITVLLMLLLATVGTTAAIAAKPVTYKYDVKYESSAVGQITIKNAATYTFTARGLDASKQYELWYTGPSEATKITDVKPTKTGSARIADAWSQQDLQLGSTATFELRLSVPPIGTQPVELTLTVEPTKVAAEDDTWSWTITLKGLNPTTQQYEPLAGQYVEAHVVGEEGYFGAGTTDAAGTVSGQNVAMVQGTESLQAKYAGDEVYAAGESNVVILTVGPPLIHTTLKITDRTFGDPVQRDDGFFYYSTVRAQGTLTDASGTPLGDKEIKVTIYYQTPDYKRVDVTTTSVRTDSSGNWDSSVLDLSAYNVRADDISLSVLAEFNSDGVYYWAYDYW